MPCYKPLRAYRLANGDISFIERGDVIKALDLACGQCVGCRLERSRQWAARIMFEASQWGENIFLTLTYDQGHLPDDQSLDHKHFQLFFKRLRKRFPNRTIRYYMCGEYGEQTNRPHYHACVFNYKPSDARPVLRSSAGFMQYDSSELKELWPYGFSTFGDLNFQSAAYCARYVMKKITGQMADEHYTYVDTSSGEIIKRKPEYCKMSLKPGIGAVWFDKYKSDVYPHDEIIVNAKPCKPPRYFDKMLKRIDPLAFDDVKLQRELDSERYKSNNTPDRLKIREQVANLNLNRYKRSL